MGSEMCIRDRLSANSGGASKAGKDLYVNYTVGTNGNTQATISSDYTLPDADGSRTFIIPAYASSATKSLTLLDDIIYEYNEDIVIELDAYTTDASAAAVVEAATAASDAAGSSSGAGAPCIGLPSGLSTIVTLFGAESTPHFFGHLK